MSVPAGTEGSDRPREASWLTPVLFGALIITVIAAWFVVGVVVPTCMYTKPAHRGTFGDQFGGINALFSGLAFGGVVIALWLQQRELKIAIREQRDASQQHARIVKTQIILELLDEIRSHEWGAAHAGIWRWRRAQGDDFVKAFLQERGEQPEQAEIDIHRRTFLKPARKVWSLWLADVIDDDFAREIISRSIADTLIQVVFPLEKGMLVDRDRHPDSRFFDFIHRLYPDIAQPSSR